MPPPAGRTSSLSIGAPYAKSARHTIGRGSSSRRSSETTSGHWPWFRNPGVGADPDGDCQESLEEARRQRVTLLPSAFCLFCLLPSAFCLLPSAFCLLPSAFCPALPPHPARQSRRETRPSPAPRHPCVRADRPGHARRGNRRQRPDLQRRQRRAAQAAAVCRPGPLVGVWHVAPGVMAGPPQPVASHVSDLSRGGTACSRTSACGTTARPTVTGRGEPERLDIAERHRRHAAPARRPAGARPRFTAEDDAHGEPGDRADPQPSPTGCARSAAVHRRSARV